MNRNKDKKERKVGYLDWHYVVLSVFQTETGKLVKNDVKYEVTFFTLCLNEELYGCIFYLISNEPVSSVPEDKGLRSGTGCFGLIRIGVFFIKLSLMLCKILPPDSVPETAKFCL